MSARGGIVAGALGLAVLETLLTTRSAERIAGVFGFPAAVARYVIDPDVPGLPDLTRGAPTRSGSPAGSGAGAAPAPPLPAVSLAPPGAPPPDRFRLFLNDPAGASRASVSFTPPGRPSPVPVPPYVTA